MFSRHAIYRAIGLRPIERGPSRRETSKARVSYPWIAAGTVNSSDVLGGGDAGLGLLEFAVVAEGSVELVDLEKQFRRSRYRRIHLLDSLHVLVEVGSQRHAKGDLGA